MVPHNRSGVIQAVGFLSVTVEHNGFLADRLTEEAILAGDGAVLRHGIRLSPREMLPASHDFLVA
jgi:hypothetical protein